MSEGRDSASMVQRLYVGGGPERIRALREEPQWRPGAMRPEDRERLVRIGLGIVMGKRAGALFARRAPHDSIEIGDDQQSFGCPPDVVLGDDPRMVLEHDVEWLVDELCETKVAWGEQLPVCPLRPGSHPLVIAVTVERITASCPVASKEVRSASF